jgi:uncharacterized protein (TIGR00299 family) protein
MIGYIDAASGASGDMLLSALVDAGWAITELQAVVERLKLPEACTVAAERVMRGPIAATHVEVRTPHSHQHRHLHHIEKIISAAELSQTVKERAIAVFTRLAVAEAKVHNTTPQKIHFHEVGALDAIIDIVGTCAGLEALGVEKLFCSALPLGSGWTQSEHGQIPIPAPATLELLAVAGAPTRPSPGPGELLTPTGAALLCELATFAEAPLSLRKVGTGAGGRNTPWPNVLRLLLGEPAASGGIVELTTNIDNMNPEWYAPVMEMALAGGALDVWLTPVQMKKNRPGVQLSILSPAGLETAMAELLLRHTTTLGVRSHAVSRHEADRRMETVQTAYGEVRVKVKLLGAKVASVAPEFEDCRRIAGERGLTVVEVQEAAVRAARRE